jgi:hypothetical protein
MSAEREYLEALYFFRHERKVEDRGRIRMGITEFELALGFQAVAAERILWTYGSAAHGVIPIRRSRSWKRGSERKES